jgi:hypothetical protein
MLPGSARVTVCCHSPGVLQEQVHFKVVAAADSLSGCMQVAGGPKIDMQYGRKDALEDKCGDTTGLPAGNAPFPDSDGPAGHLRNVFYRMGFNDQEIVALSGAHTLGRAFKNRSGIPGEQYMLCLAVHGFQNAASLACRGNYRDVNALRCDTGTCAR